MVDLFIDMALKEKEIRDEKQKQSKTIHKKIFFQMESIKFQRLADYLRLHKSEIEDYIEHKEKYPSRDTIEAWDTYDTLNH